MENFKVLENSKFGEDGQKILSVQQKKKNELEVKFYILTYTGAKLSKDGVFTEEVIEDAREKVNAVRKLNGEIAELHRQPVCKVKWGEEQFVGILKNLEYRYTMYAKDGTPVQANFTATFQESIDIDSALQNDNTPQSPDRTKYRPVYERTQLFQMA
ncbi:MAG: hypothetical protein IJA12_06105 [Oscillospiraceae bacterium]|nr:hypothetical protein [Oscillospiraceae bacterium]